MVLDAPKNKPEIMKKVNVAKNPNHFHQHFFNPHASLIVKSKLISSHISRQREYLSQCSSKLCMTIGFYYVYSVGYLKSLESNQKDFHGMRSQEIQPFFALCCAKIIYLYLNIVL